MSLRLAGIFVSLLTLGGSVALLFAGDGVADTASPVAEQGEAGPTKSADAVAGGSATQVAGADPGQALVKSDHAQTGAPDGDESHVVLSAAAPNHPLAEGCLADAATLEDLKRQKADLEHKAKQVAAREAELKSREQAVNEQIKTLATARDEIEKIDSGRKAEADAKVAKLVETVEAMNPKAAAQLLGSIDEALAATTMSRLSTTKLSKVMNVMDLSRSSKLSEILAGVARAKSHPVVSRDASRATNERNPAASNGAAGRAGDPRKAGDKNDGKSHEQASNRTNAGGSPGSPR